MDNTNLPHKKEENKQVTLSQIALIGLVVIFAINYLIEGKFKTIEEVSLRMEKRIDYALTKDATYEKNMNVLQGTSCSSCHLIPNMMLPKSSLNLEQFKGYVRGTNRFNTNSQMPKFDEGMVSDADLEKIYRGLY